MSAAHRRARRRAHAALLVAACSAVFLSGCSWVPTAFQRTAQNAASTFSSAAETLRLEHADPGTGQTRLTKEYAIAAFVSYREAVSGVAEDLPRAAGAPDDATVLDALVVLVRRATAIVEQPCVEPGCDWQTQIQELEQTRDVLLQASS
ncbi:MAG TPA: hypothetical protein VIP09_11515 [Dehalococcoidia bacterium]